MIEWIRLSLRSQCCPRPPSSFFLSAPAPSSLARCVLKCIFGKMCPQMYHKSQGRRAQMQFILWHLEHPVALMNMLYETLLRGKQMGDIAVIKTTNARPMHLDCNIFSLYPPLLSLYFFISPLTVDLLLYPPHS